MIIPDKKERSFLFIILSLTVFTPFAMDKYTPSFPSMVTDLHTINSGLQLSVGFYLFAVGMGQLFFHLVL